MKIHTLEVELFHADGRTDGQTRQTGGRPGERRDMTKSLSAILRMRQKMTTNEHAWLHESSAINMTLYQRTTEFVTLCSEAELFALSASLNTEMQ
jgi:hypothetical protein